MDLTDCFVFSCNGKEGQGNKATVLAAPGSPDTSVEHKGGGSVDPGSSRVPSETPALLAAGKEKPRIANIISKKNKVGEVKRPDFKAHY